MKFKSRRFRVLINASSVQVYAVAQLNQNADERRNADVISTVQAVDSLSRQVEMSRLEVEFFFFNDCS